MCIAVSYIFCGFQGTSFFNIWFEEPNRYKNSDEVLVDYEISHFLMT